MPRVQQNWAGLTVNPLIAEQLDYDCDAERRELESRVPRLNQDQQAAYDRIIASVDGDEGNLFLLSGPGGAGKTFVYNTVACKLRSESDIVLCVSSSGISSLLMRGGRTAHSTFKIPIDGLHERSVCPIPKNSARADLFRACKIIIWDEISAQHRLAVEAVDRTLRDIRGVDRPFGGMTVVLGGDCRRCLWYLEAHGQILSMRLSNAPTSGTILRPSTFGRTCDWMMPLRMPRYSQLGCWTLAMAATI
jgi:hypothetical protein